MMVSFFKTGDWFKESGVKPLEKFIAPYRYNCVLNIVFWSIIILVPFFYCAFNILTSGNIFHILLFIVPLGLRAYTLYIIYIIIK